jgi:hypothetical protein
MRNHFELQPPATGKHLNLFSVYPAHRQDELPDFTQAKAASATGWKKFWESGGAIDFSGSVDPRAAELERRIILSQYLLRVQETGSFPPQETGLTYNSWFGKPHLEMHWWHAFQYALWGRIDLLEKSLSWYSKAYPSAKKLAQRQGFEGARWQKMTDNEGMKVHLRWVLFSFGSNHISFISLSSVIVNTRILLRSINTRILFLQLQISWLHFHFMKKKMTDIYLERE